MKQSKIEFISTVPGLASIQECRPVPANKMTPSWWKNLPLKKGKDHTNVKACPSFPDYFSSGYIIPMWVDSTISYDKATGAFSWTTADNKFDWDIHPQRQMLDDVSASFLGDQAQLIFKSNSPWRIITPKGWSVYQLPLFYHYDNNFSVLPGIIDTDIHHQINQQVAFTSNSTEVFIKRGTPFVQYVPFRRKKLTMNIRELTLKDKKLFEINDLQIASKFHGSGSYRKMQKSRDSCPFS